MITILYYEFLKINTNVKIYLFEIHPFSSQMGRGDYTLFQKIMGIGGDDVCESMIKASDIGDLPGTDTPEVLLAGSVFTNNIGFYGLSSKEISEKTGISLDRVKSLSSGEEPVVSELIAMAEALDGSVDSILKGSWLKYKYGEYYKPDNTFLERVIEKSCIEEIYFVFSSGFLVKSGDDIKFTYRGRVLEKTVDVRLVAEVIKIFLSYGYANAASEISTKNIFFRSDNMFDVDSSVLKKYLFIEGRGSPQSYFIPFFNMTKNTKEKEVLLGMVRNNLKEYVNQKIVKEKNYVYYKIVKNGHQIVSPPWFETDFTELGADSVTKDEIIGLQENIFAGKY